MKLEHILATILLLPGLASLPIAAQANAIPCENGFADIYPCDDMDLLSFVSLEELGGDPATKAANVWGWTDPQTGREYAIVGLTDATAFVDIADPENPVYLGSLPTHTISSKYRDVKVYRDHAFIIADLPSLHGMQVFDLSELADVVSPPVTFTETAYFDDSGNFGDGHNLYINTESGFAYVVRATTPERCAGAVYMIDIRDPLEPSFAGCFSEGGLASDSICVNYRGDDPDFQGREVCIFASDDDLIVADVTDKSAPVNLATLTYPDVTRAHNAWLTVDHNFFVSVDMNDELGTGDNTRVFAWDFRDVDAPQLIGIYNGPTASSDHNIWVRGKKAYIGNFRAGVRILDIGDIAGGNLVEDAFFDMIPDDDNPGHNGGAWAVYAFFPSRTIAVTDKETGLYLLRRSNEAAVVADIDYEYSMDDGSGGSGTYTALSDGTFDDDTGGTGQWAYSPGPPRELLLQYEPGFACAARSIGHFATTGIIGVRRCQDGSRVRGVWRGRQRAPAPTSLPR